MGREVDGLAEEGGPLDRDLAVEEGRDLCNLSNSSLYGHSLVSVVLVVRTLSPVPFYICLLGLLVQSIFVVVLATQVKPIYSGPLAWCSVCCAETLAVV